MLRSSPFLKQTIFGLKDWTDGDRWRREPPNASFRGNGTIDGLKIKKNYGVPIHLFVLPIGHRDQGASAFL